MVAARSPSVRGVVATLLAVVLAATAVTAGAVVAPDSDAAISEESDEWVRGEVAATDTAPNGTNAIVMVAPRGTTDRLASVEAIERARENGRLTRSSVVAMGDTVMFRLTLPGIAGAVANASGDTDDSRFRSFLGRENVSLRVVAKHVSPHLPRHYFDLNGSVGQTVIADPDNDTYYVAADLTKVPSSGRHSDIDRHPEGDFVPRLVVDGEHRLNPGDLDGENQTGEFELLPRDASPDGIGNDARLDPGFAAATNQTITGYTTLAPGSTVTVRVTDAAGIETPRTATGRVTQQTVEPDDYGPPKFVFETALDLSGVVSGSDIGILLASNGTTFDVYEHDRYRAPVDSADAEVELPADPIEDGAVRVERATLPDGGFVAVERVDDGPVVGSTDYLEAGTQEGLRVRVSEHVADNSTLRVSLAHDSDGDERYFVGADRYYADSMRPVGATVSWNATAAAIDARTTTPNATVMVAPDGKREALSSRAAIRRAQRDGWLTRRDRYTKGDTFVLRLTAPGIAGGVANESGPSDEARFRSFLARSNTSLMVSQKHPTTHFPGDHLHLDAANVTTVVADPGNDTYYVAADLTTLPWSAGDDDERLSSEPRLTDGNEYVPRFVVDGDHRLNPDDIGEPNQTAQFRVDDPDASVEVSNETTETVSLAPEPNQTITGLTNLAPGSEVTVRLSNGTGEPFPLTKTVHVEPKRYRFRASFDLSGAAPKSSFEIQVRAGGRPLGDTYDGYVDPELATTPTVKPTPTTTTATPTATDRPTARPTPTIHSDSGATSPTPDTTATDGLGFDVAVALAGAVLAGTIARVRRGGDD